MVKIKLVTGATDILGKVVEVDEVAAEQQADRRPARPPPGGGGSGADDDPEAAGEDMQVRLVNALEAREWPSLSNKRKFPRQYVAVLTLHIAGGGTVVVVG